ncbi:doxX family protein [Mycobacterium intracellulare 1956]|uniref:DoxX family protein n=1 Tax=Mycobacterium intracellulare 1956 TaxID=1299331 RepID=X8CHW0_MYCIT|nr:doxX family protein [Mycobacterium intracellulare 1956]
MLSAFRLVYGLLFAAYGSRSLFDWPVRSPVVVAFGSWPGWYAGLIEIVAGLLVAAGLFTRTAAFIASGEMAVAYFWMHQPMALWPVADPPGATAARCPSSSASRSSCWSSSAAAPTRSTRRAAGGFPSTGDNGIL